MVLGQTDEIQVYDAEIADRGMFNLMIHTNSHPSGGSVRISPAGLFPIIRSTEPPNGPTASPIGLSRGFICRSGLPTPWGAAGPLTASNSGNC